MPHPADHPGVPGAQEEGQIRLCSHDSSAAVDGLLEDDYLLVVRSVLHYGAGRATLQHCGGLLLLHNRPLPAVPPADHLLHQQEDPQGHRGIGGEEQTGVTGRRVMVDVPVIEY